MNINSVWHFLRDERGNYAVIFTLAALPLMAGVGMAFDYVQASSLQSGLARSADQAALAAIQEMANGKPKAVMEKTAKAMLLANLGPQYKDALKVRLEMPDRHSLKVSAKLKYKPMMAPLYAAMTGNSADHFDYVIELP
jgi:hypothetical protein